jgi:hypothetical protein
MKTCEICGGHGYIQKDDGHFGIPEAIRCDCMVEKALLEQAEKAWVHLGKVPVRKRSPLIGKCSENLVVSSHKDALRLHLRASLAHFSKPQFFIKVVGDHTLMSAWLGGMSLQGKDIADPDFQRDLKVYSLEDLAEAPYLLVIRLGTKMARNSAMSEVLLETIEMREHLDRPTWIVDEPDKPLEEGHLAWSRDVEDAIEGWSRIRLDDVGGGRKVKTSKVSSTGNHKRLKL